MATNKDILEAQRYNRRRLLTAFMAGTTAEGGEFEAKAYSRPLLIGAGITAVLVVLGLVLGRFSPSLPGGWQNSTLVLQKGSGARLLSVEGVLRPVTNITSARLLSEPGSFRIVTLPAATLAGIQRGSEVGLPDAPDSLPLPEDLRSEVWTSCSSADGGARTWVARQPRGLADAGVAVVSNQNQLYVVAAGRRHTVVRANDGDAVRLALRLDQASVHPVSGEWLSLFARGSDLAPLAVPGAGSPAAGMPARLSTAVIGSVIEVADSGATRRFVVSGDRTITPLSDTAFRLQQVAAGGAMGNPLTATSQDLAELEVDQTGPVPQDWPAVIRDAVAADRRPCARLGRDDERTSELTSVPADAEPGSDTPGVSVAGSSGALVRGVSDGTLGAVVLVSDQGVRHGLGGDPRDTLSRLGYTDAAVSTLPAPWLALVPDGQLLSADAAWATVKES